MAELVQDAHRRLWAKLTVDEADALINNWECMCQKVVAYLPIDKAVRPCRHDGESSVPWWVVSYLAKRSQKHIGVTKRPPTFYELKRALDDLERRLHWRMFFHKKGETAPPHFCPKMCMPSRAEAAASREVTSFARSVKDELRVRFSEALRADKHSRPDNRTRIDIMAEQTLKEGKIVVMESDKEGLWAVTDPEGFKQLESEVLANGSYDRIDLQDIDSMRLRREYMELVKKLTHDARRIKRFLLEPIDRLKCAQNNVAKLRMKLKTHEQPGKVKARPIHDSSRCSFSNAGVYISDVVERCNEVKYPHLLRDSADLVQRLEGVEVAPHKALVAFDVADYYPTPQHDDLVNAAGRAFENQVTIDYDKVDAFKRLVTMVLHEQYVRPNVRDAVYRANKGSAIGMRASGGLCDNTLGERELVLLGNTDNLIDFYSRFKDDGFMICDGSDDDIVQLINEWNCMSDWRIEKVYIARRGCAEHMRHVVMQGGDDLEVVCSDHIDYLDLTLWFGDEWASNRRLDIKTFVKPTSNRIPLAFSSNHMLDCKLWWPKAEARRHARNCTSFRDAQKATKSLVCTLQDYPQEVVGNIQAKDYHLQRPNMLHGRRGRVCFSNANSQHVARMKLRFDSLYKKLNILKVFDDHKWKLSGVIDKFSFCFRNHTKHLRLAIRSTWPI